MADFHGATMIKAAEIHDADHAGQLVASGKPEPPATPGARRIDASHDR